jgi:hypothetical protein
MFDQTVQGEVVPFREVPDGIFLVKKRSIKIPIADHYGVLVAGRPLRDFGIPGGEPVIIHRTPDIRAEWAETTGAWEKVEEVPRHQTQFAVARALEEFDQPNYYALTNNCEHTARYITSGEKKSTQVNWIVGAGFVAFVIWLMNRSDG